MLNNTVVKKKIYDFQYLQQCSIDVCDVTLSGYPHREGLKNMAGHGGIGIHTGKAWKICLATVGSHRGQAYFSSLPGVDTHSE